MKQDIIDAQMRAIGRSHSFLCRIPVVGAPIARGMSRLFAVFPFLGGVRPTKSAEETRQMLRESGEQMGFPFEFSEVEGDTFVLELPHCPYGFTGKEHQRPCDTAMEMDRFMLRLCGADLTIDETIPKGAKRCRMTVRQRS
jgi:hypothetical protein